MIRLAFLTGLAAFLPENHPYRTALAVARSARQLVKVGGISGAEAIREVLGGLTVADLRAVAQATRVEVRRGRKSAIVSQLVDALCPARA